MYTPEQRAESAQKRLYWAKHGLTTSFALAAAVALSAFARPLSLLLVFGCAAAGVLLFLAEALADRGHTFIAVAILPLVFVLFAWVLGASGLGASGTLMWVQGSGTLFASFLAARAVHGKLRAA